MLEDMTVPDVLLAASSRTNGIAHRRCRQSRQIELHDDSCNFTRIHAHRIFPSPFVWIRRQGRPSIAPVAWIAGERLPLNQLHINEVEVNWMCITSEIHDLPHFDSARLGVFG